MKYSVIIPAYNAQNTIRRCLDSLLPQLPEDAEIIIVDDGSRDATKQICTEYASGDPRIRLYTKDNGGVSSARNVGLDHASGEFILFVDSDDAVKPEYFRLIRQYTNNNPDFVLFHNEPVFSRKHEERSANNKNLLRKRLSQALRLQLLCSPWGRVFRKALIDRHKLRFDERISIGEDKVFVVQYTLNIDNASFVKEDIYQLFTDNAESLSRKKREYLEDSVLLEHKLLFDAAVESGDKAILHAVTYSFFRSAYTVILELQKFSVSRKERIAKARVICEKYCAEKRIRPGTIGDCLVAAPILLKMVHLIDCVLWFRCHFGIRLSPLRF